MTIPEPPKSDRYLVLGGDGKTYAADILTLKRWAAEGRVTRETQVFQDGVGPWRLAGELSELFGPEPPIARVSVGSQAVSTATPSTRPGATNQGCLAGVALVLIGVFMGVLSSEFTGLGLLSLLVVGAGIVIGIIGAAQRS
jgi:hypothetical protein